ncbi:unnamed protein product [Clonostachys solani]|uniref:Uncharacterized protein n=1 Tax=Clonostachys solani TaxID=160281 RepID=A0A9N9YXW2_9HYPO|nr:unnamed protein product [Clonostachys solani]
MATFEALPQEIVIAIGEMCAWPASSEEPPPSKHLAALIRTGRWLYNLLNATLYRKNLKQGEPLDSCVLWAAENGRLDTIKMAVSFGADLNADGARDESDYIRDRKTKCFQSPLIRALRKRHENIVYYLLDMGVDSDPRPIRDWDDMTALDITTYYYLSDKIALALVRTGHRLLSLKWDVGFRELADRKIKVAQALLEACDDASLLNQGIRCGISMGNDDIATWGLQNPLADVSTRWGAGGETLLHFAIRHDSLRLVELMLTRPEVNVSALDNRGRTPLHTAASRGNYSIVRLLLAQPGIIAAGKSIDGETPLSLAISEGNLHCAWLLLERPEVNLEDLQKNGATLLHILCQNTFCQRDSTLDFVCYLIDHGCPLDAELDDGRIALDVAIGRRMTRIARLLRNYTIISGFGHGSSQTCRICRPIDQLRSDRTLGSK